MTKQTGHTSYKPWSSKGISTSVSVTEIILYGCKWMYQESLKAKYAETLATTLNHFYALKKSLLISLDD